MVYYCTSWFVSLIGSFILGFFIISRPKSSLPQKLWAFFCFLVGFVSIGFIGSFFSKTQTIGLSFIRLINISTALLAPIFLHFVISFCEAAASKNHKRLTVTFYAAGFVFVSLLFTPYVIKSVELKAGFQYWLVPGPLYFLFMIYFCVPFLIGYFLLFSYFLNAIGLKRLQVTYFFIATFVGVIGGLTTFLPAFLPNIYPFGIFFIPIYCFIIGYAIVRHHLMDIEVIIKKTLVFAGLLAVLMSVVAMVTTLAQSFAGQYLKMGPNSIRVLSIVVAMLLFDPVRKLLVNLTDQYLFQKKVDYRQLLKEASEYLAHVDSLKKQTMRIVSFMIKKARIANASIFVYTARDKTGLRLEASRPAIHDFDFKKILFTHPLIVYLYQKRGPIEKVNLIEMRKAEKDSQIKEEMDRIFDLFTALKAEAAVPCFGGEAHRQNGEQSHEKAGKGVSHLRGILFLGPQKSDEPYSDEELDVFFTLAQESSIAFENARLYDEALQKQKELALMNRELERAQHGLIQALEETESANKKLQITQASLIVAEKSATMVGMAKAIGHEVNNPLSTILGRGEQLIKYELNKYREIFNRNAERIDSQDVAEFEKLITKSDDYLRRIVRSGERIEIAVRTLTNILKDTRGEIGPLSLIVLCREAIEAARFSTYEENLAGCELQEHITSNVVIMGNLEQLIQVFVNLIKNAYEAMHGQSRRVIEIHGSFDKDDPKMAKIEFSDNGPGMPPEVAAKIWLQGFSTKTRKDDSIGAAGQGQGLFVTKHIVESIHKGSIGVKSEVGKGTTFVIKLPLAEGVM